jgi:hypothetical protein
VIFECLRGNCRSLELEATGVTDVSRRGLQRAGIRCKTCRFAWLSSLPQALELCRVYLESQGRTMPTLTRVKPEIKPTITRRRKRKAPAPGPASVKAIASTWDLKAIAAAMGAQLRSELTRGGS